MRAGEKHSSLFDLRVIDEVKKFYNIDARGLYHKNIMDP
jgi:hypothetical protein